MHIIKASKAHGNLGKDVWSSPSHALCTTAPEPASSELKESDTEHRFILGNLCWQRISEFFLTQQTFLPTLRPWTRAVHVSPACTGAREGFAPGVQHKCVCFGFFCSWNKKWSQDSSLEWLRYICLSWQDTRPSLRDVPTFVITV